MIDWAKVPNFKSEHFPESPDMFAEPDLIYALQAFRTKVRRSIFPSPVAGALARFAGGTETQHYVGDALKPIRKSTAVDIFVEGIPISNLFCLLSIPNIKGIGIYLHTTGPDGKPWIMFHIDIRSTPLVWICEKVWKPPEKKLVSIYRYPQTSPQHWNFLQNELMYYDKIHGKQAIKPATTAA